MASRHTISLLCNGLSQSSGDRTDGDCGVGWGCGKGVGRCFEGGENNTSTTHKTPHNSGTRCVTESKHGLVTVTDLLNGGSARIWPRAPQKGFLTFWQMCLREELQIRRKMQTLYRCENYCNNKYTKRSKFIDSCM